MRRTVIAHEMIRLLWRCAQQQRAKQSEEEAQGVDEDGWSPQSQKVLFHKRFPLLLFPSVSPSPLCPQDPHRTLHGNRVHEVRGRNMMPFRLQLAQQEQGDQLSPLKRDQIRSMQREIARYLPAQVRGAWYGGLARAGARGRVRCERSGVMAARGSSDSRSRCAALAPATNLCLAFTRPRECACSRCAFLA